MINDFFLTEWFFDLLRWLYSVLGNNYFLTIFIVTLALRIIQILPDINNRKNQRKQAKIQPEIEKLKKKMVTSPEGTLEYKREMEAYNKKAGNLSIIMKTGKDQKDYEAKIQELLDIDVADVKIHKINLDQLEGIELDSSQVEALMFMIEE